MSPRGPEGRLTPVFAGLGLGVVLDLCPRLHLWDRLWTWSSAVLRVDVPAARCHQVTELE
jgi:hypothetical protein